MAAAFFRVGVMGYGGGPSSIPLVHAEAVTNYGWLSNDDFGDVLALANALPGPIATKMAAYIGYRVAGGAGAAVSILVLIAPTVLGMIVLLGSLQLLRRYPAVRGMTLFMRPVVAVMLGLLVYEFLARARRDLGWVTTGAVIAACLVALDVARLPSALVVVGVLVFGGLSGWRTVRLARARGPLGRGGAPGDPVE